GGSPKISKVHSLVDLAFPGNSIVDRARMIKCLRRSRALAFAHELRFDLPDLIHALLAPLRAALRSANRLAADLHEDRIRVGGWQDTQRYPGTSNNGCLELDRAGLTIGKKIDPFHGTTVHDELNRHFT